jgi:hypothetical protein
LWPVWTERPGLELEHHQGTALKFPSQIHDAAGGPDAELAENVEYLSGGFADGGIERWVGHTVGWTRWRRRNVPQQYMRDDE